MSEKKRLIVVILGSAAEYLHDGWYVIHQSQFNRCVPYTCVHQTIPVNNDSSRRMVFVKEDSYPNNLEQFKNLIKTIISNSSSDIDISLAVHNSSGRLNDVSSCVNSYENVNPPKGFSRIVDDSIWANLKPLVKGIIDNSKDYDNLFEALWRSLTPQPFEVAHSLRSQILTPFVALHLALQYAEENKDFDLMKECEATFEKIAENNEDGKVKEFLQANNLDKKDGVKSKIDKAIANNKTGELANFKDLYEGPNSGKGLIGDFADLLEEAVRDIEAVST